MTDRDPLDHAREHYRGAKMELKQREWNLVFQLQGAIHEQIDIADTTLTQALELVREIPPSLCLDQNAGRMEAMKTIEELRRGLKHLRARVGQTSPPEEA